MGNTVFREDFELCNLGMAWTGFSLAREVPRISAKKEKAGIYMKLKYKRFMFGS